MDTGDIVDVDIYEASSNISAIGAGINFWPRSWEIMKNIGLESTLVKFLAAPPDDTTRVVFHVRKSDQADGFPIQDLTMKGGSIRFHRADLQSALMSQLHGRLHLSHRLVSYEEHDSNVLLNFQNGATATCDLLVGMDGIKSGVRKLFLQSQGLYKSPSFDPIWTGTLAYRGLIPIEKLEKIFPGHNASTRPVMYCGKFKHVVVYPVSQDRLVNVVAFATAPSKEGTVYEGPSNIPTSQAEVLAIFNGWEAEVQALLHCIEHPSKWAIHALRPLDCYAFGRVMLAGDAAHGMTPHQGAGAGQAIEDAYILATLISRLGEDHVEVNELSKVYNTIRCPAGNRVLEGSRRSGLLCELVGPGFEDILEGDTSLSRAKLATLIEEMQQDWRWAWAESAEDDRQRALAMLSHRILRKCSRDI
ncbi:salicylate hydroxylase [Crassisporium funariophilum]|nr:salicylate hydroxylase [Crassisporium funariophilum]